MSFLGCPTLENLKHILRQQIITNCPVTIEDVNVAADIYGPDVGTLKGKSTRPKSTPYKEDYIEIPPEIVEKHSDLRLCIDLMYLCLLYTSPSPRDLSTSRMPSSA